MTEEVERAEPADLRRALGRFATGVTVITAESAAGPIGFTASSFNSVSLDPPLILWSLSRGSERLAAYRSATAYAVNVLRADQADLAHRFAGQFEDRFAGVAWRPGSNGAPVIEGSLAVFECAHEAIHAAGDHDLFIGRVLRCHETGGAPLTYFGGGFGTLADELPPEELDAEDDLVSLLGRATGIAADGERVVADAKGLRRALRRYLAEATESA